MATTSLEMQIYHIKLSVGNLNFFVSCVGLSGYLAFFVRIVRILGPIMGVDTLKSFLNNRKQLVTINGYESGNLPLNCGVAEGSTLGSLLFLLYINNFRFSLQHSSSSHFADDTCIIYSSKKIQLLESAINNDLKSVTQWLNANRLSLNVDKTKLIIFHSKQIISFQQKKINIDNLVIKLNQSILIPCNYVKYLGVQYI